MTPAPCVDPGLDQRRPEMRAPASAGPTPPPGPALAVAAGAGRREDGLAAGGVPGPDRGCAGRSARTGASRCALGEREHSARDADEHRHGPPEPPFHQKPNRTFVKYQRLDVSQRTSEHRRRAPPATGSTQCGYRCSRVAARLFSRITSILADEDAVDEGARDRVDRDAGVRRLEPEDEDAVEEDGQRAEDREPPRPPVHPLATGNESGTTRCSLPHMRDAVRPARPRARRPRSRTRP